MSTMPGIWKNTTAATALRWTVRPARLWPRTARSAAACIWNAPFPGRSSLQDITLYPPQPPHRLLPPIDWHEQHVLLKAAFPVDICADRAQYDIQFGSIARDTHTNTSWDEARFEVCAHKWADLSEPGYGAALLNDGRYGYDVHDGVLRLSLLRAATYPDPPADQGAHDFTYALLPHLGDWRQGRGHPRRVRLERPGAASGRGRPTRGHAACRVQPVPRRRAQCRVGDREESRGWLRPDFAPVPRVGAPAPARRWPCRMMPLPCAARRWNSPYPEKKPYSTACR